MLGAAYGTPAGQMGNVLVSRLFPPSDAAPTFLMRPCTLRCRSPRTTLHHIPQPLGVAGH